MKRIIGNLWWGTPDPVPKPEEQAEASLFRPPMTFRTLMVYFPTKTITLGGHKIKVDADAVSIPILNSETPIFGEAIGDDPD